MKTMRLALIGALGLLIVPAAEAAQYVYPTKGQDKAKTASDESECSVWATQQTGFDPAKAPANAAASSAPTGHGVDVSSVTSALGSKLPVGSMGGAVGQFTGGGQTGLGGIPGLGGAAGGQQQKPGQAEFDKARAACLNGRGYSVQ